MTAITELLRTRAAELLQPKTELERRLAELAAAAVQAAVCEACGPPAAACSARVQSKC